MSGEVSPEMIKKTQNTLGKFVKKPALTEKLLKKPPFRFLHDILKAVVKETGFLKDLYSEAELNSDNVKEKDSKIAFLNKLINAVKSITKTDLNVRSSKIVAGLEPSETNLLLQTIGQAIDKKLDSREYVKSINDANLSTEKNKVKRPSEKEEKVKKSSKTDDDKKSTTKKVSKKPSVETPKSTDRIKLNTPREKKIVKKKEEISKEKSSKVKSSKTESKIINEEPKIVTKESPREEKLETKESIVENTTIIKETPKEIKKDEQETKTVEENTEPKKNSHKNEENQNESHVFKRPGSSALVRPKSARPKSGDREKIIAVQKNVETPLNPIEISTPIQRPKSTLRPPSVRPSSARPGAPRLRPDSALPIQEHITMGNINVIVENVDVGDEEDIVVIQTAPEIVEEPPVMSELKVPEENKGHLVEQILKQIEEEGDNRKKIEIDWEEDASRGKEATNKEITQLRSMIQNLTKTANPLGKLLNYLHEDIEAMVNELQMWSSTKKQLLKEIDKQKKISNESNKPLLSQLEHVQQEIKKQEIEIIHVRSNILKNDQRIKELLIK
ncbi:unnamed protein product [Brassicogethes aeneus]|uniref:TRAF3-interacting protein 1 n=1 Tax=Brassicogethes aeneus TaxID=1431903 RepID=A0A9P0FCY5_BRAAE|nr:unnamed protein product [Brassicogethes aeneus]